MSHIDKPRVDDHYKNAKTDNYAYKFDVMCDILNGRGKTFLDIAGGLGGAYLALKNNRKESFEYTLVEFSDVAISQIMDRGVSFIKHNIDKSALPLEENSHQVVLLVDVLEHMRNPWALLAEATRVSDEYVYVSGPNFASLLCRLDILFGHPIRQMVINKSGSLVDSKGRHADHIHFLTYNNLIYWAGKLGLTIVDKQCFIQRRLRLLREPLDSLVPNLAESYSILFKKDKNFVAKDDPNFLFYDFL